LTARWIEHDGLVRARAVLGLVLLLLVVVAPARAAVQAPAPTRVLVSDGLARTYRVYRPAALPAGPTVPLVVVLHGGFGGSAQAEMSYGWDQQADSAGFVVAYPDGVSRAWNAGTCCGPPQRFAVDDVAFLDAMTQQLITDEVIDRRRVFFTGMSNGAMMAYRMACERPGLAAAIGPVAGTMTVPCDVAAPTSVFHIHGLADQNVPYAGGTGTKSFAHDIRPSVPSVIERWRAVDGCAPGAAVTTAAPVTTSDWSGCVAGTAVRLVTVDGAGHQWPGGQPENPVAAAVLGLDPPSSAMDATAALWAFFAAHPSA
jgi:polyhydroxybutyrate depolymerase